MPENTKPGIAGLERLSQMFEAGAFTKAEAARFIKVIQEFVLKLDSRQQNEIDALRQAVSQLMTKIESKFDTSLTELKSKTNSLFVGDRVKKLEDDHGSRMKGVEERMAKVRDGYTPVKGKDYRDGKDGQHGNLITPEEVVNKVNQSETLIKKEQVEGLEELNKKVDMATKQESRRVVSAPHNLTQYFNATSQADGFKRVFVGLPTARYYPMIFLKGQNPVTLLEGVDYTVGRNSITLDNSIEPPASEVGVYIQFIK